jgi:hypothetical protein
VLVRLIDAVVAPELSGTDPRTASWPSSAPLVTSVRRAAARVLTPVYVWFRSRRQHSPRLRVSERWLAEHERYSSKHQEST